jgi:phosphatidylinositol-3-phosphatase
VIDYLLRLRLTWRQTGVIAILSGLATGLVIAAALGHGSTPSAVIAALSRRVVIRRHVTPTPTPVSDPSPSPTPSSGGDGSSTSGGSSGGSSGGGSGSGNTSTAAGTGSGSNSTGSGAAQPAQTPAPRTYKVKHVFVIALSAPGYKAVFGRGSQAPYLNGTLKPKGTLLSGYETLGGAELPEYLAMVSGQAPNPDTRGECASYVDFAPSAKPNAKGLMSGSGCVYPNTVLTLGDQVTAAGADWKAYIGDMGSSPCIHPNSGALDDQALPFAGAEYDTRHNPFIYFHSLLDLGDCSNDDLSLTALPTALKSHTPEYTFIAPNACADAASETCPGGAPGGLAAEDAFLKTWVPKILASPAYRRDGVLVITFAAATPSTPNQTTTATTTTTTTTTAPETTNTTPSSPQTATPTASPIRVGGLVLSRFATARTTVAGRYNAYSLLRTTETLLGFTALGHATQAKTFIASALPGA